MVQRCRKNVCRAPAAIARLLYERQHVDIQSSVVWRWSQMCSGRMDIPCKCKNTTATRIHELKIRYSLCDGREEVGLSSLMDRYHRFSSCLYFLYFITNIEYFRIYDGILAVRLIEYGFYLALGHTGFMIDRPTFFISYILSHAHAHIIHISS